MVHLQDVFLFCFLYTVDVVRTTGEETRRYRAKILGTEPHSRYRRAHGGCTDSRVARCWWQALYQFSGSLLVDERSDDPAMGLYRAPTKRPVARRRYSGHHCGGGVTPALFLSTLS